MNSNTGKPEKPLKYHDLIDQLEITDLQKEILKQRWADQTVWHGKKSREAKKRMNIYRIIIISGGVIIPALTILPNTFGPYITTLVSLTIAIAAGLEGFFKYAEKHSQYRETAEILKIEGWSYFSCTGIYKGKNHKTAFKKFTQRVESIIREDVRAYINLVQEQIDQTHETTEELEEPAPVDEE